MTNMQAEHEFEGFSTRTSFNKNLGHFRAVTQLVKDIESGKNPGDVVQKMVSDGTITPHQILPIAQSILIQKFNYQAIPFNLKNPSSGGLIAAETVQWNALDLVLTYFHPESGVIMINPKNPEHWAILGDLKKFELVTVYLGAGAKLEKLKGTKDFEAALQAGIKLVPDLFEGKKVKAPAALLSGSFSWKAEKKVSEPKAAKAPKAAPKGKTTKTTKPENNPAAPLMVDLSASAPGTPKAAVGTPAPAAVSRQVVSAGGKMTVSTKIGIQVTNELFHNGNVEAWKRIIESYSTKYSTYKVTVYYEGEVIHDINSLFKWGKVKHGTSIFFSVAGPDERIADLSKLRKYLFEGASPRFESFLRGTPGKILELF